MTEAEMILWVTFLSLVGLVYSLVFYFTQRIGETRLTNVNRNSAIRSGDVEILKENSSQSYAEEVELNRLMDAAINVYGESTLHMVIAAVIFCIIFCLWLAPANGEFFMAFAFMCGVLVNLTSVYITLQASIAGSYKTVQQAQQGKQELIQWTWQTSTLVGMFQVSLIILFFTIVMWIYKGLYLDTDETLTNSDKFSNMFVFVLGYGLGIIFSNMMYRDAVGNAAKSASIGGDIMGRGPVLNANDTIGRMSNLGELVANQIVNIADLTSVLVVVLVSSFLLISQSPTILESNNEAFYFPLFVICWTVVLAIAMMFLAGHGDIGKDSSRMVASNFTIQIVITAIFNLFLYVFVPRWVFPQEFVIGDTEEDFWYETGINKGVISWCLTIGLITQLLLMTFVELFSSKVYSYTQELEKVANTRFGFAKLVIDANVLADKMNYVTFSTIALSTMLGFLLGGFYGIALVALGIVGSPIMLIAISSTCSLLIAGNTLQRNLPNVYATFLRNAAWSAKSQLVFLQVINVGGLFMANLAAIGAIFVTSNTKAINFFDGFVLMGFLCGSGMVYFLKGVSVWALKDGSNLMTDEVPIAEKETDEGVQAPMNNEYEMFDSLYRSSVLKVLLQLVVSTATVLILGMLFGTPSMIGYVIGINFIGIHTTLHSLILSYSLKNAQAINQDEQDLQISENTRNINQAQVAAKAVNSTPGSALLNFLAYNTLLVLFAASVISGTSKPMVGAPEAQLQAPEIGDIDVPTADEATTLLQQDDAEVSDSTTNDEAYGQFGEWLRDNVQADADASVNWAGEDSFDSFEMDMPDMEIPDMDLEAPSLDADSNDADE